ncbi:cupredoxin domain-containing protein [Geodermatophilus ruber]|uniref:Plastocyanin n=1 Tax=Geodermatophilus ruber TaxID=504800 RepID=A0A1I4IP40_9ACTN|nr:cupredoxin domain-containing protein [Geodermatophilus ruber]SFL56179.1 Plastocyanin [Geodermatophilus ruber]
MSADFGKSLRPPLLRRRLGSLLLAVSLGVLVALVGGPAAAVDDETLAGQVSVTEAEFSIAMPRTLTAGSTTFAVRNAGSATHDLVVSQNGRNVAATPAIPGGGRASLTVTLQRGTYVFYCSIDNHRAMGMEVTVSVT